MHKRTALLTVLLVAIAASTFGNTQKLISEPPPTLRTWMVRMSTRIEGWAIYRDGASAMQILFCKRAGLIGGSHVVSFGK